MHKPQGEYIIYYRRPKEPIKIMTAPQSFQGRCLNFTPAGKCAFANNENQYLVVHYCDILQLVPIKKNEVSRERN